MRVPSPILAVLKHHSGTLDPGDEVILVPPMALPTIQIPVGLTETNPGQVSGNFRAESFMMSFQADVVALTGTTAFTLAALRPGLWRLDFFISCSSGAEPAITDQDRLHLGLQLPAGSVTCPFFVIRDRAAGGPINFNASRLVSLERETNIQLTQSATGAGDSFSYDICVYAARLL